MSHYQPRDINEFRFKTDEDRQTIQDLIDGTRSIANGSLNGIILHGEPGHGKTTCANLLPKAIEKLYPPKAGYGEGTLFEKPKHIQVTSGNNGANLIAGIIDKMYFWSSNASGLHYIIFDEVDRLSPQAMDDLRGAMNNPTGVFIMTTNYIHKVSEPIIDRCRKIEFGINNPSDYVSMARNILGHHNIDQRALRDDQLTQIISKCSKTTARKIGDKMEEVAKRIPKLPDYQRLLEWIAKQNPTAVGTP